MILPLLWIVIEQDKIIRDIIKNVNPDISEQIKWNAPRFSYRDYRATFHLREKKHVHLVVHYPAVTSINRGILEGNYGGWRGGTFDQLEEYLAKV